MALKIGDKSNENNVPIIPNCVQEESKKSKPARKKYSSKKTELQVRMRTVAKVTKNTSNHFAFLQNNMVSEAMFYPPCPQYYSVTLNERSTVIPAQYPLYSLQSIPIVVNPVLSTQICPYSPIPAISPVTIANEVPISPLVPVTNEFSLHTNDVSAVGTSELPVFCELSPMVVNLANGYESMEPAVLNNFSPFANEIPPKLPNEFSAIVPFGYEFPPLRTPESNFSPVQYMHVANELTPYCAVSNEISPNCSYESFCEYIDCENPFAREPVLNYEVQNYDCIDPLEFYLSLPKDLFPTARMMTIDPNSIIDEFCKVSNLSDHSWILDLEFGVPKTPVSRRVATYNVKLNSIHCKNTPEAIHPGFESCDKELKRALMFYYDCVISNWYRGYMAMSSDRSVENFQSWLLLPMQVLGMCWP